jgi:ribosomal protein S18 acetylase RimI-like enzyme
MQGCSSAIDGVCQGVARRLIQAAVRECGQMGVRWLYVHAAAPNVAAVQLYTHQCGFELEQEESEDMARRLNRPKRFLYRQLVH